MRWTAAPAAVALVLSTAPPAVATPTPTPTATPHADPAFCSQGVQARLTRPRIRASFATDLRVEPVLPEGSRVQVLAYTQPSTQYVEVRDHVLQGTAGTYTTRLWPPRSTRLYVRVSHEQCVRESASVVVGVEPLVTVDAQRTAPREYVFSGRHMPARPGKVVSLYRVADGRRVLTAQGRVADDGTYRIARRFLGSGRWPFVVVSGGDVQNLPGESRSRDTVVH